MIGDGGPATARHPLSRLADLVDGVVLQGIDLMIARALESVSARSMPFLHRYVGTPALTRLVGLAGADSDLTDSQSGFRAFRKATIDSLCLSSTGMELASEMLIRAGQRGLTMAEIPLGYRPASGDSKLRTWSDGARHFRLIMRLGPHVALWYPGLLLMLVSASLLIASLFYPGGLAVGDVLWQPVFAASILAVVGVCATTVGALLAGFGPGTSENVRARFGWVGLAQTARRLRRAALALVAVGVAIDCSLLAKSVAGWPVLNVRLQLATVAQVAVVVGSVLLMVATLHGVLLGAFARPERARTGARRSSTLATAATGLVVVVGVVWWRWAVLGRHGDPVGVDFGNLACTRKRDRRTPRLGRRHHLPSVDPGRRPGSGRDRRRTDRGTGGRRVRSRPAWPRRVDRGAPVARHSLGHGGHAGAGGRRQATSAAAAWGGLPQLVGFGLAPIAVVAAARLVAEPTRGNTILLGALLLALAAVSPLVFGLTLVCVLVALALAAAVMRTSRWVRHAIVAAAFVLPLAPLYVRFLASATVRPQGAANGPSSGSVLRTVFVGATPAWFVLGALALLAPFATRSFRFDPLWVASTTMTATAAAAVCSGGEARFSYLAPTAAVIAAVTIAAWTEDRFGRPSSCWSWRVCAGSSSPHRERCASNATSTRASCLEVPAVRSPGSTPIPELETCSRVAPVAGVPFGWWLEGWGRRPSLVGADPQWLAFPGERRRAREATRLFTGTHWPSERDFVTARRLGVRWLYLPSAWDGIDPSALRAARKQHPGLVVYRGSGATVLRVPEPISRP